MTVLADIDPVAMMGFGPGMESRSLASMGSQGEFRAAGHDPAVGRDQHDAARWRRAPVERGEEGMQPP